MNSRAVAPIRATGLRNVRRYTVIMRSTPIASPVLRFPSEERARREQLLGIAAAALPVLQAALEMGNATMVARVIAALGAMPCHDDALALLEAIGVTDAEVVDIRRASSRDGAR